MVPRNAGSVSSGVGHSAKIRVFISCSFSFGIKTPFDILPEPIMNNIHSAENRVTILGRLGIYFTPTLVISPFGDFSPWVLLCSDNMFASVGNICRLEYGRCTKYLGTKYHMSLGRSLSGARRDPDDCAKIKSEYDVVHWRLAARNIFFMGCH